MKRRIEVHLTTGAVVKFRAEEFTVRHVDGKPTSWKAEGMRDSNRIVFLVPSTIAAVVVR